MEPLILKAFKKHGALRKTLMKKKDEIPAVKVVKKTDKIISPKTKKRPLIAETVRKLRKI